MADTLKCPKCGEEMEWGRVAGDHGNRWFEEGSIIGNLQNLSIMGLMIITSRCKNCGYLESYAK